MRIKKGLVLCVCGTKAEERGEGFERKETRTTRTRRRGDADDGDGAACGKPLADGKSLPVCLAGRPATFPL
jgi:hypothetical protein